MISSLSSSDDFTENHDKVKRKSRFQVENGNGYIFDERYTIPEKVLPVILCYVEPEDLVFNCRLVCKAWCNMIDVDVWKLKFEKNNYAVDEPEKLPWFTCYSVFSKKQKFWNRNLVKNGCGQEQLKHWTSREHDWKVEKLKPEMENFPLEMNDDIKTCNACFVPSAMLSIKEQIIDLAAEGIAPEVMDIVQPNIIVSEWFKRRDSQSFCHKIHVVLINEVRPFSGFEETGCKIISKNIEPEDCPKWHKVEHVFKNYGPGVRRISLRHYNGSGSDCKLTGASVTLQIPLWDRKALRKQPFGVTSNNGRVCKAWCNVIDEKVWKLKFGNQDRKMQKHSWVDWYWFVLNKKLWNRNLVKNGCGQDGLNYWEGLENNWRVEKSPLGSKNFPSRMDDEIQRHYSCFAAANADSRKAQTIDLVAEGATPAFMDKIQPKIVITDWHCGRNVCQKRYVLLILLRDEKKEPLHQICLFCENMYQIGFENVGDWHKRPLVFQNYGSGVRYVSLHHCSTDEVPLIEDHGFKITGTSITLQIPDSTALSFKK